MEKLYFSCQHSALLSIHYLTLCFKSIFLFANLWLFGICSRFSGSDTVLYRHLFGKPCCYFMRDWCNCLHSCSGIYPSYVLQSTLKNFMKFFPLCDVEPSEWKTTKLKFLILVLHFRENCWHKYSTILLKCK